MANPPDFKASMLPHYSPPVNEWATQVKKLLAAYRYDLNDADVELSIRVFLLPKIPSEFFSILPDPPAVGAVLDALQKIGQKSTNPYFALQGEFYIEDQPSITFLRIKAANLGYI